MKTGDNIALCKRAKGLEKLYSKPWSRFKSSQLSVKPKWLRKDRLQNRNVEKNDV